MKTILFILFSIFYSFTSFAEEDWEMNDEIVWKYEAWGIGSLQLNQDSTMLIAINADINLNKIVYFFELEGGNVVDSITGFNRANKMILENNSLFIASDDSIFEVDINTKQILKTFSTDTIKNSLEPGKDLESYYCTELILKDGFLYNCIVSGSSAFPEKTSYIIKYNIETSEIVSFKKYNNEWESFDISPDGKYITMYSVYRYEHDQPRFVIEDLATGRLVWNYYFDHDPISMSSEQKIKYIENGKYIYIPIGNYKVQPNLFDIESKEFINFDIEENFNYSGDFIKIDENKYVFGYVVSPKPYGRILIYDIVNHQIIYTSSKISRLKYSIFKIGDFLYGNSGKHITKQHIPNYGMNTVYNFEETLYPNPTNGEVVYNFNNPSNGLINWNLINLSGDKVLQGSNIYQSGFNTININLNSVSNGEYLLVITGVYNSTIKIVKVN